MDAPSWESDDEPKESFEKRREEQPLSTLVKLTPRDRLHFMWHPSDQCEGGGNIQRGMISDPTPSIRQTPASASFVFCNFVGTWLGGTTLLWEYHPGTIGLPPAVPAKWFCSDVAAEWVSGVALLVIATLFTDYREWLDAEGHDVDGVRAPAISSHMPKGRRLGEGVQQRTFFSSGGLLQHSQMGLGPDDHFAAARDIFCFAAGNVVLLYVSAFSFLCTAGCPSQMSR